MTEEGEEDSLFFLAEDVISVVSAGAIGLLTVDENNRADVAEVNDAPILLSGRASNLHLEDMVDVFHQGIAID